MFDTVEFQTRPDIKYLITHRFKRRMSDLPNERRHRCGTSHRERCCPASVLTVPRPCYSGGKDGALEPVPAELLGGIFLQKQSSVLETATGRRR